MLRWSNLGFDEMSNCLKSKNGTSDRQEPMERVLLIACGALAKEILELKRLNGWNHIDLTCLPAELHLYPEKIPERVELAVKEHRQSHSSIFVVYADCGTGGLPHSLCVVTITRMPA